MKTSKAIVTLGAALTLALPGRGEARRVICWGDSITEGMAMPRSDTYPARLQTLLGKDYLVLNSGDGGEDAVTIPARQGALPLVTAGELAFGEGARKIRLGAAADNGFRAPGGARIKLTQALGREMPVNPVTIGTGTYRLSFSDFRWNAPGRPITYTLWLERESGDGAVTIPAGTPAAFASAGGATNAYCEVVLMGANGGWGGRVEALIAAYGAMFARRGPDKPHLAIVPYWGGFSAKQADAFRAAFGARAVDFRAEALARGLTLTNLMYRNRPDCHLNADGYALLARLVFERGKALGYW